jgi:hypothetical protein
MKLRTPIALLCALASAFAQSDRQMRPPAKAPSSTTALTAFQAKLLSSTIRHLDLLLDANGNVASLKGKSSDAMTASSFYIAYELTGKPTYRLAAVQLADRILKAMRAIKFGVLYIKQKEKGPGKEIPGGGPPAMGWYTADVAHILHGETGREADLKYIATVLDNFPWNEKGWWSADIDVNTGESKQPMSKPSPINKNVAMAMAAARVSLYIKDIDPALSARLSGKAKKCIYDQIIPAQQSDGYWHYGLTGNDPKNKDILGYFMVTMDGLIQLRQYTDLRKNPAFLTAMGKADSFAVKCIAPIADPNTGPACSDRTTPSTPTHYTISEDPRRGFQLGLVLLASRNYEQGMKIINETLKHFPYGDTGADGSHAVHPCALMLLLMSEHANIG